MRAIMIEAASSAATDTLSHGAMQLALRSSAVACSGAEFVLRLALSFVLRLALSFVLRLALSFGLRLALRFGLIARVAGLGYPLSFGDSGLRLGLSLGLGLGLRTEKKS